MVSVAPGVCKLPAATASVGDQWRGQMFKDSTEERGGKSKGFEVDLVSKRALQTKLQDSRLI